MSDTNKQYESNMIYELDLDVIEPNPDQPRSQAIPSEGLLSSIKTDGIRQPILVRHCCEINKVIIVDGACRYNAAIQLGLKTVPVRFDGVDNGEKAFGIAFSLNFHRESLTTIETAEALQKIKDNEELTQAELGTKFGMKQNTTNEYLGLTRLTKKIKDKCRNDKDVSKRALLKISKMTAVDSMEKAFEKYYRSLEKKRTGSNEKKIDGEKKSKRKSIFVYAENNTEALKERYKKIAKNLKLYEAEESERFQNLLEDMEDFISKMKSALYE